MRLGSPGFCGIRLRQARLARSLSEAELAKRLHLSRQSVSLYELGGQTPSPAVLQDLAAILAVPNEFFFWSTTGSETPDDVWFRSLESASRRARHAAVARFGWFVEVVAVLQQHGSLPPVSLPILDVVHPDRLPEEQVEDLADEYRRLMGFADGPIHDLLPAIERCGIIVTRIDMLARQLDAFSSWIHDRPFIMLDQDRAAVRQRLDLAHELGHIVLHRGVRNGEQDHRRRENQAFRFGAALLFPRAAFVSEVAPDATLSSLTLVKRRWKVSIKMMIRRARDLEIISGERMKQLFKQYSAAGYARAGEPLDSALVAEAPALVRQSLDTLLSSPEATTFLRELFLPAREVEALCSLPSGYLERWLLPAPRGRPVQASLF